jgi:hypothetical protein
LEGEEQKSGFLDVDKICLWADMSAHNVTSQSIF